MVQYLDNKINGFQKFSEMKEKTKPGFGFLGWMLLFLLTWWLFMPGKKADSPLPAAEVEQLDVSKVPRMVLTNDKVSVDVQGLRISNVRLGDYKENQNSDEKIKLLAGEKEFAEVGFLANGTSAPAANTVWKTESAPNPRMKILKWRSDTGVEFRRRVVMDSSDGFVIIVGDEIRNDGKKPVFISQYSRIVRDAGAPSKFAVKTGGLADVGGEMETESWDDIAKRAAVYQVDNDRPSFAGFSDQYWQVIISSLESPDKTIKLKALSDKMFQAEIKPEFVKIEPGKEASFTTRVFAGPKTQSALLDAARSVPGIDRTLDYGWFGFLSRPFLWTLNKLHDVVPNYGIAIILLTIIIRGLMWPLTKKSFRGMAAMQKIQPEMQRIQKLYADDKMRLQQEILNLYRTHKANPLSSIGIMFLQIPIFFALYKALLIAVPLRHAGFLWLSDLSVMDPYFVLPLLMAATMFLQNRITGSGKNPDAPGASVMKYMPWVFAVLFAWMPSGLVLYWTVSNIFGIVQLAIMKQGEKNEKK